jgi:hypothetical protein
MRVVDVRLKTVTLDEDDEVWCPDCKQYIPLTELQQFNDALIHVHGNQLITLVRHQRKEKRAKEK